MRSHWLLFWLAMGLGIYCMGCPKCETLKGCPPGPVLPDAAPVVVDVFAGAILDCSLPAVATQRPQATQPATHCLVSGQAQVCLGGLATMFTRDTVACVVRDLGTAANFRVLAGTASGDATIVDGAAREWLSREKVGFR